MLRQIVCLRKACVYLRLGEVKATAHRSLIATIYCRCEKIIKLQKTPSHRSSVPSGWIGAAVSWPGVDCRLCIIISEACNNQNVSQP